MLRAKAFELAAIGALAAGLFTTHRAHATARFTTIQDGAVIPPGHHQFALAVDSPQFAAYVADVTSGRKILREITAGVTRHISADIAGNCRQLELGVRNITAKADKWTIIHIQTKCPPVNRCTPLGVLASPPHDIQVDEGGSFELRHEFSGDFGSGQWYFQGQPIPGEVEPRLSSDYVDPSQDGQYVYHAVGRCGGDYWLETLVHVTPTPPQIDPPSIVVEPEETVEVIEGGSASIEVVADGEQLTYQWYETNPNGNVPVDGATVSALTFDSVWARDSGRQFYCVITNPGGSVTSATARLSVIVETPPSIDQQPQPDVSIEEGQPLLLTAKLSSKSPVSCQWYCGSKPVFGQTSPTLKLSSASVAATGTYVLEARNRKGVTKSRPSKVNVRAKKIPLRVVSQPTAVTLPVGGKLTLTALFDGGAGVRRTVRWKLGSKIVSTSSGTATGTAKSFGTVYSVKPVKTTDAGKYTVTITDETGSTLESRAVVVTVKAR